MKRFAQALFAVSLVAAALAPVASADFGIERFDFSVLGPDGQPTSSMQAGSHPFAVKATVDFNVDGSGQPEGAPKDIETDLPAGFLADPKAVPRCSAADFLTVFPTGTPRENQPLCPDSTAVGYIAVRSPNEATAADFGVAYNLTPSPGSAAKIGIRVAKFGMITIDGGIRPSGKHNAFVSIDNITQLEPIAGSELVIWGNPSDPAHDEQRGACLFTPAPDKCSAGVATVRPFITLPGSCEGPLQATLKARSWQNPGAWVERKATTEDASGPVSPSGCGALGFASEVSATPTTTRAEGSSGLDFSLDINDPGLMSATGTAQSAIRKTVVRMPEGMTVNPAVAAGLQACSKAAYEAEALGSQSCPDAAKIGDVEVETPLLEGEVLKGQLFVATPDDPGTSEPGAENPFDSLIAFYMVIKDPDLGILVSLPGRVDADAKTGQLTTTVGEAPNEIPQFPFSHFRLHFREGDRGPLVTPPRCGTYSTDAFFTPWANPAATQVESARFDVSSGVAGGPCPSGTPPFNPTFSAGSINNSAGQYSPFYLRLTRGDGEQDITRLDSVLPSGLTGKIAGLAKCSDVQIAAAKGKTGRQELANPSCPAGSEIGHTLGGAGVGSQLLYVPGKVYLGGPFGGDPLSIVAVTPAVAGPFDAGTVVVREALDLDPTTAEVLIDGSHSDPIPHILKGVPLKLRDLRVYVDRPNFTLNPTGCQPKQTQATIFATPFNPLGAGGTSAIRTARYQAANCASLRFKPKVSLKLTGGTKRGAHPALQSVVDYPKGAGYANIAKAIVTFPHSAFLEQSHIRTVCTRVQFAAKNCPAGSIYGHVKATTPLLDEVVEGPVYLRSSSNPLPDLVFALRGIVEVDVVARIDSIEGRIRAHLDSVPDVPVSKFVLNMQGGKKGLIVNSRNLCATTAKARVQLTAQSGKAYDTNPPVVAAGCKKGKK
jgi:hypothetical protein